MQQYYKNTLPISIAKYKAGAMNAVGLLFDYIKVKFRSDWKIVLKPKQVCSELSISSSTFYRALKKVGQLLGKVIYLRQEKAIPTHETEIPTHGNSSPTHETEIPSRENEKPQTPSKNSQSSDTPDLNSNLFQISLSKIKKISQIPPKQREKFLSFAMARVDELPKRPTLPSKWITANFADLYSEYKKQSAPETVKATTDREFSQWYELMRTLGHLKGQRIENGVQLVEDTSGFWSKYEDTAKFWTLEYLKKCLGGR